MWDVRLSHARQYVHPKCSQRYPTYCLPEYPHYLSQPDFQEYLESYANHFDLQRNIVFNAQLKQVLRNKDDSKWRVDLVIDGASQTQEFDKVAFCHGYQTQAKMPHFESSEKFAGEIIHGQAFKKYLPLAPFALFY